MTMSRFILSIGDLLCTVLVYSKIHSSIDPYLSPPSLSLCLEEEDIEHPSSLFPKQASPSSSGTVCSNSTSISSKLLPPVSGKHPHTNPAMARSSTPNNRNVAHPIPARIYGVLVDQTKLPSHWAATPAATPGSRIRVLKSSAVQGHGRGPQEKL